MQLVAMTGPAGEPPHNRPPVDERPAVPPPRRRFTFGRPRADLEDVDAGDRVVRLRAGLWAGVVTVVGIPVSLLLAAKVGATPPLAYLFLLGGPLAGIAMYKLTLGLTMGSAAVMGQIHNPSGDSTPFVREYSKPQALAAHGHYREAIEAYGDAVAVYPEDPEPYLRIARLLRDRLHEFEEAVTWFKRARSEAAIDPGRELLVSQEIIEIYRHRLETPARAIPELARLIERFPDHPFQEAARRELAELRAAHLRESD